MKRSFIVIALSVIILTMMGCMTVEEWESMEKSEEKSEGVKEVENIIAEEERKIEELIPQLRKEGIPVVITEVLASDPNSAGGVFLRVDFRNVSDRTIKYFMVSAQAFNRVDDPVQCRIKKDEYFKGKATGPFPPDTKKDNKPVWDVAWYNQSIDYAKIKSLEIVYMDDTTEVFEGEEVEEMLLYPDHRDNPFYDYEW